MSLCLQPQVHRAYGDGTQVKHIVLFYSGFRAGLKPTASGFTVCGCRGGTDLFRPVGGNPSLIEHTDQRRLLGRYVSRTRVAAVTISPSFPFLSTPLRG